MPQFITKPEQATPAWITAAMREFDLLPVGDVTSVEQENLGALASTSIRLHLEYSESAPPDAPASLFLKFSTRANEINFYRHLAYKMPNAPLLKAISADYNSDARMGYLLFPDIDDQFISLEGKDISQEQILQTVLSLADTHAHWWDHPELHTDVKDNSEDILSFIHSVAVEAYPQFVKAVPELLQPQHLAIYEKLLTAWPYPALKQRLLSGKNLTVVHGDAHFGNILFSRNSDAPSVLLLDWAVWHINTGPTDIAYLGAFAPAEVRAKNEQTMLNAYHDRLIENGIKDYSYDDCWLDYRQAALAHMIWPVFWWAFDLPELIWRGNLVAILSTSDDLGLGEFLE